jgi:DNA modification methylase
MDEIALMMENAHPEVTEDEVPEVPVDAVTKLGDLWLLGEHRVLCGDSTSEEDVSRLMNGEKADMVFTDPPYGMKLNADYSGMKSEIFKGGIGGKKYDNVKGDHNDFTNELIGTIFSSFADVKEIFIWGADYFAELLPNKNDGSWIVWDKRANNNDNLEEDKSSDKMYGSTFELCWSKNKHKREIARVKWAGIFGMPSQDTKGRVHPTQKPIELVNWFIKKWGNELYLIADLYLGSGTTLIAAEQLGRKCYGMEISPNYCDVIVKRWENLTGKKATLAK